MSAIAEFKLISVAKLPNLVKAADPGNDFHNIVLHDTKKLITFDWSGYIFADLLIFLQEKKNINLLEGEYDAIANQIAEKGQPSVFILTYEHKLKYASSLILENFSANELIEFNKDFSESDDPELAKAQLDGIAALKQSLDSITSSDFAVLLFIG